MNEPNVGVVILHWNTDQATETCLRSVFTSTSVRLTVVVYDNGSSQDSRKRLQTSFPQVFWIGEGRNVGFARAVNLGIQQVLEKGCDAVFLLNNDALVDPDTLQRLTSTEGDIVSPRILSLPDREKIWFDGGRVSFLGKGLHIGMGSLLINTVATIPVHEITFTTACAMLIRRKVFSRIGLFDEDYYAYSEDLDLCVRATGAGLRIVINHEARAYHAQSVSVKQNVGKAFRDYYVMRNRVLFLRKHFTHRQLVVGLIAASVMDCLGSAVVFCLAGQFRRAVALSQGLRDGIKGQTGKRFLEA